MDDREEKIRVRAYEIWERQGHTGDPEDHWHEAVSELKAEETSTGTPQDHSEATVQEASPIEAVEALEAASDRSTKSKGSREPSKS
jgi:hypothetical protein